MAVREAIRKWNKYIQNGTRTVVRTDHEGLKYMQTVKHFSQKLARWIDEFNSYDLDIQYKPGKQMIIPDTLSRRQDLEQLNILTYEELMPDFLESGALPEDEETRKEVQSNASRFVIEEGQLRYRTEEGSVPCISLIDRMDLIETIHKEVGHASARTILDLISHRG